VRRTAGRFGAARHGAERSGKAGGRTDGAKERTVDVTARPERGKTRITRGCMLPRGAISSWRHTRPQPAVVVACLVRVRLRASATARGPGSKKYDGTVGDRSRVLRAEERCASPVRACRTSHHVVTVAPSHYLDQPETPVRPVRADPFPYARSLSLSLSLSLSFSPSLGALK